MICDLEEIFGFIFNLISVHFAIKRMKKMKKKRHHFPIHSIALFQFISFVFVLCGLSGMAGKKGFD